MVALRFSETSVLTRETRRNILDDGILHSHLRLNFRSYKEIQDFMELVRFGPVGINSKVSPNSQEDCETQDFFLREVEETRNRNRTRFQVPVRPGEIQI
jgi:hypothetical protein